MTPDRRVILSWSFYDFANSSFTTLIITIAYSVYFRDVVVAAGNRGDLLWGRAVSISMLLVALTAPALGAIADRSGSKKRFMMAFAGLCILCTALLALTGPGDVTAAMLLFIAANIGFAGGNVFYNAFLPEIAPPERIGRVSGLGWALGYIGGLACLGLVYPLLRGGMGEENRTAVRASFAVVALFFLVFALPAFRFLKDRGRQGPPVGAAAAIADGYRRTFATLRWVGRYRDLVRFLFAYFLFNDGIHTVTAFSSIYAIASLGYTMGGVVLLFVVAQLTAFLGAFSFGPLLDRIGGKRTITISLVLWCVVIAGAYFASTKAAFAVVVLVAGFGMGANQAASRGFMGLLIPAGRSAEFFGFFALCGKFSAIIGPALFGWIADSSGDQHLAILSLGAFFVAGLGFLGLVDEGRGRRQAGLESPAA